MSVSKSPLAFYLISVAWLSLPDIIYKGMMGQERIVADFSHTPRSKAGK